jgi:CheY-like chemotaxis protein
LSHYLQDYQFRIFSWSAVSLRRILLAGNSSTLDVLTPLLSGNGFELMEVKTMPDALAQIRSWSPDLVICGMLFEESRMFDFLRAVKNDPAIQKTPFICSRVVSSDLPEAVIEAMNVASRALGACLFLDIFDLLQSGKEHEVLALIEDCLPARDLRSN